MFMTEVLHERTPNEMNIINNSNITELANKNTKKRKNKTKNEIPDGSDPISRLSPVDLNNLISSLSSQCMRPASLDKVLIGSNCYQHGQMLESLGFQERLDGDGYYLKLDKRFHIDDDLISDASTESDHMFGPDLLSPKPKLVSEGSILIKTPPFTFTGDHLSPIRQFQNENMYEHRRPSTIESFHSKFEMESFQYNDSRNRNNSSKSKNSLYRPSTMSYDLPSHSHLSPRTEHLCLSQNDAANIFSTPKQTSAILSGEGEYDWCNSLGACTVACAHLLKSHVPANDSHHSTYRNTIDHNDVSDNDSSNVLLTRLRRSSTISNLPPRPRFGNNVYSLPFTSKDNYLVKLADFGTSVIGSEGLGDPINVEHFTTLENSPPEFYLLGSLAKQGYSADTFSLGLAVLHLFTGLEPYEELLSKVLCPEYLIKKISKIWRAGNKTNPYNVIKQVIDTLDESNNMSNRYPDYGLSLMDPQICRSRMLELHPNMMKLLEKMLHFDPSRRCTMHEALSSNIFDNLLSNFSDNDKRDSEINYLYYYRSKEQGGLANLPIV
eukprot:gene18394-24095_t